MKNIFTVFLIILTILILTSCKRKNNFKYDPEKINIVTTTTIIADLTKEIGKEHVNVMSIMETGINPHSYIPRPSVIKAISEADLVVSNGLNLEAKMGKILQTLDNKLLELGNHIDENELIIDKHGQVDPHIWFSVNNWIVVGKALMFKLIEFDPLNEESYLNNYNSYKEELICLDIYIKEKIEILTLEQRILITAHDAFSYFGKDYGFKIYSIQGISTETEASAKDIKQLAELIVNKNVKAIFLEKSIPENTIKALIDAVLIKKHKVIIGGNLYTDSLGTVNDGAQTYLKMVKKNIDTIIEGLK